MAKRPKPAKLVTNPRLRQYVRDGLEGKVQDADGREISRPRQAPFKGRNKPLAVTVNVSMAGRLSRLPTGSRSIFRMMNSSASLMKPYIKRSTLRVEELSSANW